METTRKKLMFISKLNSYPNKQTEISEERMRESNDFFNLFNHTYVKNSDNEFWNKEYQHNKPILNSRKKMDDFLISGSAIQWSDNGMSDC